MTLKRLTLLLLLATFVILLPAAGIAVDFRVIVPGPPVIVAPAPPPPPVVVVPGPPPPPAVVVEPAQPVEQYPQQEYQQQDYPPQDAQPQQYQQEYPQQEYQQQELPAEEYIPEGDPTPPPPLAVQEPELVVVPSGEAQVYMVPNTVGVYFYGGWWYRQHHGVWFRTVEYNQPWVFVQPAIVPSFVVGIPPAYALYLPPTYHRIHYGEFRSNWRTWDRDRRWQRERWYQNERRADIRRDRIRQANARMEQDRRIRDQRIKERERNRNLHRPGPGQKTDRFETKKTGQQDNLRQHKTGPAGTQKFERGGHDNLRTNKTGTSGTQKFERGGHDQSKMQNKNLQQNKNIQNKNLQQNKIQPKQQNTPANKEKDKHKIN
jgi:hypothetical protein